MISAISAVQETWGCSTKNRAVLCVCFRRSALDLCSMLFKLPNYVVVMKSLCADDNNLLVRAQAAKHLYIGPYGFTDRDGPCSNAHRISVCVGDEHGISSRARIPHKSGQRNRQTLLCSSTPPQFERPDHSRFEETPCVIDRDLDGKHAALRVCRWCNSCNDSRHRLLRVRQLD